MTSDSRPYRQIQAHDKASHILRLDPHPVAPGFLDGFSQRITIRQLTVANSPMPTEITVDAGEFARELDGIVPGFTVKYDPKAAAIAEEEAERERETRARIDAAILTLKSAGYEVTPKAPDSGTKYVADLAEFANGVDGTRAVRILESQGAHHLHEALQQAAYMAGRSQLKDVEVYVEIDRALLISEMEKVQVHREYGPGVTDELWSHLWPVVARIDEQCDVILHVTSGDRAHFGKGI